MTASFKNDVTAIEFVQEVQDVWQWWGRLKVVFLARRIHTHE